MRSGPAIKKIGQALAAAEDRAAASDFFEDEYSEIQEATRDLEVILQRFRRFSASEAEALDKLLIAIENYVVVRSQAGN